MPTSANFFSIQGAQLSVVDRAHLVAGNFPHDTQEPSSKCGSIALAVYGCQPSYFGLQILKPSDDF